MRLTTKDTVGIVLVAGTFSAVVMHNNADHRETHLPPVADAGGSATSAETGAAFAFVDFNVVPMNGEGLLRGQVVVVQDGFVTQVGPVGVVAPPANARRVEGDGTGYLVPGLTDAHVHLAGAREDFLPLFLANGVTTVFNLEGDERHLSLRDRAREPDFLGPTIFTSGPFLDDSVVRTPAEARRTVFAQAEAGYDFIKIHGNMSEASYAAVMEAAREVGIPVVGHAPRNLPFSVVLEQGQAGVAHAEELIYTEFPSLDVSRLESVAASLADIGTWVTPTLANFGSITEQWASPEGLAARLAGTDARYLPTSLRRTWRESEVYVGRPLRERGRIEAMHAFHTPLVQAMHDAGVPLLAGTDTPMPGMVPGFSLHDEIEALHGLGLSRAEALAAATVAAGRFVRGHVDPAARFGTIEPGARADLVFVGGDPLEDLNVMRQPFGVMVRGRWYERRELAAMLVAVAGTLVVPEQSP